MNLTTLSNGLNRSRYLVLGSKCRRSISIYQDALSRISQGSGRNKNAFLAEYDMVQLLVVNASAALPFL